MAAYGKNVVSALAKLPQPEGPWDLDARDAQQIINDFCGEHLDMPYQIFRRKWNAMTDGPGGFTAAEKEALLPLARLLAFAAG